VLQKGEGEHRHECMAVKAWPGSPFEVVEPKFLFQLLMGLLDRASGEKKYYLANLPAATDLRRSARLRRPADVAGPYP
jgi:hypothetical protein